VCFVRKAKQANGMPRHRLTRPGLRGRPDRWNNRHFSSDWDTMARVPSGNTTCTLRCAQPPLAQSGIGCHKVPARPDDSRPIHDPPNRLANFLALQMLAVRASVASFCSGSHNNAGTCKLPCTLVETLDNNSTQIHYVKSTSTSTRWFIEFCPAMTNQKDLATTCLRHNPL
jgi:hypothetical protein